MGKFARNIGIYILIILLIMTFISFWGQEPETLEPMNMTELIYNLEKDNIQQLELIGDKAVGTLQSGNKFEVHIPRNMQDNFYESYLKEGVEKGELDFETSREPEPSIFVSILPTLLLIAAMAGFWFIFMQRSQGGGSQAMSFGKNRAKRHQDRPEDRITFNEVAGLYEEKEELTEVVDFLKEPEKYIDIGARIPTGILMIGPPGTGKTYLSRAVAGEAGVPFFTISGSDFVEMFVGVGASRVRDLFNEAKKNSPCIIFIDEIDAVGRRRGAGLGGGHDEREQTLNQLLVEMDGFSVNEGVIVMAATNRPDILDPALLRPGRFDRRVHVGLPDLRGREEILQVHTRKKPLAADVNLKDIARQTPGFSPADLENLTNEAAILAARHGQKAISSELITEAIFKVQMGPEKASAVIIEEERILTAYHEAGHAITSSMIETEDPVSLITIVPRGGAGGFTAYRPEEERSYRTKKQMEGSLVSLLGGRVAEELVLEDISTGASSDLQRATDIARDMVMTYGMNKNLGPVTYTDQDSEVFIGRSVGENRSYSEEVAAEIDKEVRNILEEAYQKATDILEENMEGLHRVAKLLLRVETITGEEFEKTLKGEDIGLTEAEKKANKYSISEKIENKDPIPMPSVEERLAEIEESDEEVEEDIEIETEDLDEIDAEETEVEEREAEESEEE